MSPIPKHVFDGHQGDGPLDQECGAIRSEFVGSWSKLYWNYHPSLNNNALPPPHAERAPDDWTPYCNRDACQKIDALLDIWAALLLELGGRPMFTNHADLYSVIDNTCVGSVKWENFTIQYTGGLDCVPYHGYDASNDQRRWEDFMSGDWAWEQADRILADDPTTARATLVPVILSSDKTTVLVATGQTDYYPFNGRDLNLQHTIQTISFLIIIAWSIIHCTQLPVKERYHKFPKGITLELLVLKSRAQWRHSMGPVEDNKIIFSHELKSAMALPKFLCFLLQLTCKVMDISSRAAHNITPGLLDVWGGVSQSLSATSASATFIALPLPLPLVWVDWWTDGNSSSSSLEPLGLNGGGEEGRSKELLSSPSGINIFGGQEGPEDNKEA
ncbi:hypothetical protein BKA83DRAFT_4133610 [Pisolithus microcarpus]|nr:hypothetical protein BKA83DRAFT_4133610 [Pisolithus microcarpus]